MELLTFIRKKLTTQEKVTSCFCFSTTVTHGAHAIFQIKTKFVVAKVIDLIPTGPCIENKDLCFREKTFLSLLVLAFSSLTCLCI